MSRADTLVLEHLDGRIDAERLDVALTEEQAQHPSEVTQALLLLRLHALMRGEALPVGHADRVMAAIRDRNRRIVHDSVLSVIRTRPARRPAPRRVIAAALAALLVIGVGVAGVIIVAVDRSRARTSTSGAHALATNPPLVIASGAVALSDDQPTDHPLTVHTLAASDPLPDHLHAFAGDAGAVMRWSDGSEAAISAQSRMHRDGQELVLEAGSARFTVRPHPVGSPFTVRTPHGSVAVIGTVFTVTVGPATTVAVERGTVAFQTHGQMHTITAGMAVRSDASAATLVPGWRLVWSDEFAYDGPPDPDRWLPWPRPSGINSDIQRYSSDQAHVEQGRLVITAHHAASGWTSASLMARHLQITPGMRVEMRARMPDAPGAWPLVWAVRETQWPAGPEVVLLTTTGDPVRLRASMRMDSFFQPTIGPLVATGFATYVMTWTTTGITVERDGIPVVTSAAPVDPAWAAACAQGLEFALELTVTAHDASTASDPRFEVEHIRVYEPGPSPSHAP